MILESRKIKPVTVLIVSPSICHEVMGLDVRVGLGRKLSAEELMLLNCGVGEDLDCKEIQPVHSEGAQPWDFFGRNDATAETPVLWPPHVKS